MGLDELHLRVLSTSSDNPQERKNAVKGAPRSLANVTRRSKTHLCAYSTPSSEQGQTLGPRGTCNPLLRSLYANNRQGPSSRQRCM